MSVHIATANRTLLSIEEVMEISTSHLVPSFRAPVLPHDEDTPSEQKES